MKNKEIKQIIFSRKKNKKWIIIALVLVLTLGGGSVAAVVILHRNGNQSEFSMPGNMAGLTFTEDMTAASGVTNVGITEEYGIYIGRFSRFPSHAIPAHGKRHFTIL